MEYYGNNDWRDYLAHYGVKGMKWRNHKYVKKIGDFYDYNITGQGYLRDADRYSSRARAANKRLANAEKTWLDKSKTDIQRYMAGNRGLANMKIAVRNANKARNSYAAYKNNSLVGRLSSKKDKAKSGQEYTHLKGLKKTGYNPYIERDANTQGMGKARRKAKVETVKTQLASKAARVKKSSKKKLNTAKRRVSKVLGKAKKKIGI